jgi:hypothetical protein
MPGDRHGAQPRRSARAGRGAIVARTDTDMLLGAVPVRPVRPGPEGYGDGPVWRP